MTEILITSSVLILVIAAVRRFLRGRLSMRMQYALWLLVAARLLAPVSLPGSPISVLNAAPPAAEMESLYLAPQQVAYTPPAGDPGPVSQYDGDLPLRLGPASSDNTVTYVDRYDITHAVEYGRQIDLSALLRPVWYAGMAVMAGWFLWVNLSFRRKLRGSARRVEAADCPLPVFAAEGIPSPCLVGLFRPAIYVTSACLEDGDRLRHVLAHELTHRRHGDALWSLVRCLCLTVYWFDPLVWLAASLSRRDCELACDEGALKKLGEGERTAYGRTLIGLMSESSSPVRLLQTATTMVDRRRGIRERLLLIAKKPRVLAVAAVFAVLIAAVAAACTFTGAEETAEPPDSSADPAPTETETPYDGDVLSPSELDWFNTEFFNRYDDDRRMNNMMLAGSYDAPEDIDLFWLFYDGVPGSPPDGASDRELAQLEGMHGIDLDLDLIRITAGDMAAVFREKTGMELEETNKLGLDSFVYLPEYDAYYHTCGDTNYAAVTVTSGRWAAGERWTAGGLLTLEYDRGGSHGTAVLRRQRGGEYFFVSNAGTLYSSDPVVHAFDRLLADDCDVLAEGELETLWADSHLPWDQLEHVLLDLDGDGVEELLVQYMGNDPRSTNAVFHYENGKVRCWHFDYMDGNEFQYPLKDGTMVHESHLGDDYTGYTLFRYDANGERQEIAGLGRSPEGWSVNGEAVTQQEFDRQVGALIGSRLVGAALWSPRQPYTGSVASEEDRAEAEALHQALSGVPAGLSRLRPGEIAAELLRQYVQVYTQLPVDNSLRLLSAAVTRAEVFDMDDLDAPTHICFDTDWVITGVDLDRKGDWVAGSGVWPIEGDPYDGQWIYSMQGRAQIVDGVWRITELGTGGFSVDDDGVFLPDISSCSDNSLMYFQLNGADGAYAEGAQYELGERFLARPDDILNAMTWFVGVQPGNWPDDDRDGADWLVQILVSEFTVMRGDEDRAQFETLLAGFGDEDCGGMARIVREALEDR